MPSLQQTINMEIWTEKTEDGSLRLSVRKIKQ